ncbi:MAG: DUF4114 domain-containing protein [Polyangiaceae bacterium]|nr:DUF4114 domain-containing protein [Polyangiaceae bacterium]
MGRTLRHLATFGALLAGLAPASALALQQPDGTTIPDGNNLRSFLDAQQYQGQAETIDPLTDAATTPETFVPGCVLTFTVIGRGAGQRNSFGWYNVTGQKPALSELYEFIRCDDDVGATRDLDIAGDPRWLGGEIGFFQATTQGASGNCVQFPLADSGGNPTLGYVFYSQKAYNDDNTSPNPYIHLLIMDSKVFPSAFYFGWEDLFAGGDNDFEDLLMRVEGIQCSGGGSPCEVPGATGRCAQGITQCRNGSLVCEPVITPSAETCNAIDDDCNGTVDDGDLCTGTDVCFRGTCVPPCGGGEFVCTGDLVCNAEGLCVDPACAGKACPAGEICVAGACKAPCDGVACPYGTVCRDGACVDPCAGITCDSGYACVLGVCSRCSCGLSDLCAGGATCNTTTQACVETACATVSCGAGTHCVAGNCVSDCEGATCPAGQACDPSTGRCAEVPGTSDAGAGSGGGGGTSLPDGGLVGTGGFAATGSGGAAAAGGGDAGATGGASGLAPGGVVESKGGCGCSTPGRARAPWSLAAAVALLGALARRRRAR